MKYPWLAIVALGTASSLQAEPLPYGPPPEAYRDPIDQQIARAGKGIPGRPVPCGYERDGGKVIESRPTSICYKMLPQQRWRGLWVSGHEYSIFCAEPVGKCDFKTPGVARLEDGPGRSGYGSVYRVDFVGRRTMYPGNYDGLGMFDHVIVFDRAISIELIDAAPITHIRKCPTTKGLREKWCFEDQGRK